LRFQHSEPLAFGLYCSLATGERRLGLFQSGLAAD
jgi:hypothetical protein